MRKTIILEPFFESKYWDLCRPTAKGGIINVILKAYKNGFDNITEDDYWHLSELNQDSYQRHKTHIHLMLNEVLPKLLKHFTIKKIEREKSQLNAERMTRIRLAKQNKARQQESIGKTIVDTKQSVGVDIIQPVKRGHIVDQQRRLLPTPPPNPSPSKNTLVDRNSAIPIKLNDGV